MTVKTILVRISAIVVISVLVLPAMMAQIPDWYATHKDARYPAETYIIGVGSGSGPNAVGNAKKAAQMDLVSQIRVQVQAEAKNITESFQFNKDEQFYSEFRSKVRTAVSDEVTGMQIVETLTDDATGTAYALVVLDRGKYCETIRNELDAGWKQANDLRTAAFDFSKEGKVGNAIQNLLEARKVIAPLLSKQALYNAVSSTPYKPGFNIGPETIAADVRGILSDLKLEKKSGDKQKGKIGRPFADPFVVQVTINREEKVVPVAGSTVVFETSDQTKIGDATTDDQGMASFSMTVRPMTGSGVRARISLGNADREFEKNLVSSAVFFTWRAEGSDVAFSLKVDTKSDKLTSSLKNAFTSAITQIGYKIVGSSKFVVEVTVETGKTNTIEGMAGTMYSVSANVVASLIDKKSDNTLGSVTFTGRGLAKSESEALEKAAGSAKIVQEELSELLEKALQR